MTIYDLAQHLKLSVATTSKALNGYTDVSAKTRARVLKAAKSLGYEPSIAAQSITTKRSYLLGVIYHDSDGEGLTHPHFSEILEHFKQTMEIAGYQMMFIGQSTGAARRSLLQICRYRALDGVLMMASDYTLPEVQEILKSDIPSVLVDFEWPGKNSVLCQNIYGMQLSVDYLYALGHRLIAYLTMPIDSPSGEERMRGVRAAMQAHGLTLTPEHIMESKGFGYNDGYYAIKQALPRLQDVTAIICSFDRLAFGAIHALREEGMPVPERMSIIGFDNIKSDLMDVWRLTTVEQPRAQIGCEAARLLLAQMQAPGTPPVKLRLPVRLVVRNSCARVAE